MTVQTEAVIAWCADARVRAVLAVVCVGCVVATWWSRPSGDDLDQEVREAMASARDRIPAMLSYDHRALDATLAVASANATGPYAREFADRLEERIRPQVEAQELVVDAEVRSVAAAEVGDADVRLIVLVRQEVTSAGQSVGTRKARLSVHMKSTEEGWLIADLDEV